MSSPRIPKADQENQNPGTLRLTITEPAGYPEVTTPDFYPVINAWTPSSDGVLTERSLVSERADLRSSQETTADADSSCDLESVPLVPPQTPQLKPKTGLALRPNEAPMPELRMYNESLAPIQPLTQKKKEKDKGRSTLDEENMKSLLAAFQKRSSRRNTILFAFNSNPAVGSPPGSPSNATTNGNVAGASFLFSAPTPPRPTLPALNSSLFPLRQQPLPSVDFARRRGERLLSQNRQNQVETQSNASSSSFTPKPPAARRK